MGNLNLILYSMVYSMICNPYFAVNMEQFKIVYVHNDNIELEYITEISGSTPYQYNYKLKHLTINMLYNTVYNKDS